MARWFTKTMRGDARRPRLQMPRVRLRAVLAVVGALALAAGASAASDSRRADWVEPNFPFYSSVVDARHAGPGFPANNLTPRGLVLPLGHECWIAYDTDLLRVAAIWRGTGLTPRALAPGSYHDPNRKTPGGQFPAPEPVGKVWLANGIYPGWQAGAQFSPADPREPAPSPEEVGRGPLPETMGRFQAVRFAGDGAVLEYLVAETAVREWVTVSTAGGSPAIVRNFTVAPSPRSLLLVLGIATPGA